MNLSTTDLVLAPDAAIDLHLHTNYSDGTWIPAQLLDYLVQAQFGLVAISDHDRVDTVAALQQLALDKRLPVLVAVEMTTLWQGKATDVLCFGFDPAQNALDGLAQDLFQRQCENTREVYESLIRKGYRFAQDNDPLASLLEHPGAQQPNALIALLTKHGYDSNESSAADIVFGAGCTFAANDIGAVVAAAHHSGAVCLIAHPGRTDGFMTYDVPALDQLRQEVPFDGLEAYYPLHTAQQTAMYLDYARQYHLLVSSGSDSHGPHKPPIQYPAELSRTLLERIGIQIKV